jgi:hypothetical protein
MIVRSPLPVAISALALMLGLAACNKKPADKDVAKMDSELVGNATEADPALTNALQDQIMVDPNLTQQANDHSARPADNRRQAPIPPGTTIANAPAVSAPKGALRAPAPTPASTSSRMTLGELAKSQATLSRRGPGCDHNVQYSAAWANRLPSAIPLYPDARVNEAAGSDTAACRLRVVSFASAAQLQTLIDWYYTVAIRAGYSSEHQQKDGQHILAGAREKDGGAYYIYFTRRPGGGTDVDLIANNGR